MKIWALLRKNQRIQQDIVLEFATPRPVEADAWQPVIDMLCQGLNLSRPVILSKHIKQLNAFARTTFSPADFIESVGFDTFEIELFPEDEKANLRSLRSGNHD